MLAYIIRRLMQAVLLMFVMSGLLFIGLFLIGDPLSMLARPDASEQELAIARQALGLDLPLWQQYIKFIVQAVQLDFGNSFLNGEPAMKLILERMPATLELAFMAMFISIIIGVPVGLFAGLRPKNIISRTVMSGSVLGFSLPGFWVGLMFIMLFAVYLQWLPAGGRGETVSIFGLEFSIFTLSGLQNLMLPALTIAFSKSAMLARVTRAATREVMPMDYIKFARAKGLPWSRILGLHLLKNIMIPIVTISGLELGQVVAFAVITETVFSWPGMGKLLIDSIIVLDRPVVVGYLMLVVFLLVMLNLVVDILYSILDPRVRLGGGK